MALPERPGWQQEAACLGCDPELFFPDQGRPTTDAKKVCSTCPVKRECLQYALDNHEHFGVWGGTSERQRRTIRRRLNQAHITVKEPAA